MESGEGGGDRKDEACSIVGRCPIEPGQIARGCTVRLIAKTADHDKGDTLLPAGLPYCRAFHVGSFRMHLLPHAPGRLPRRNKDIARNDDAAADLVTLFAPDWRLDPELY